MGVDVSPEARRIWDKYKPAFSIIEVQHLINYFVELAEKLNIDVYAVDFEDEVADWKLTYRENKDLIEEHMSRIAAVPKEEFDLTGFLIEEAEKTLGPIDHEVIKSKDLKRLENAAKRLKNYKNKEKQLQREIDSLRRKYEETIPEKRSISRTVTLPTPTETGEEDIERLLAEFHLFLKREKVPVPNIFDAEFYKTVSKKRTYTENALKVKKLAERIIKRVKPTLPVAEQKDMEKRIKHLEDQVKTLTAPVRDLPPPSSYT